MRLLDTQIAQVAEVVAAAGLEPAGLIVQNGDKPTLTFKDLEGYFTIHQANTTFVLELSPGGSQAIEKVETKRWSPISGAPGVLSYINNWCRYSKREADQRARRKGETKEPEPDWALGELPSDYSELVANIDALNEQARRIRRFGLLLWATGEPLNRIVRDLFREIGFAAEPTAPGATYDLTVPLTSGRLLIEITGKEGGIYKSSNKIGQVLGTFQTAFEAGDRVCIAVNAHRLKSPAERAGLDIITADALGLISKLDAIVFTTSDLYRLWRVHRTAVDVRPRIEALRTAPAGIVTV